MPTARTGSWMYAGAARAAIRIERQEVRFGSGDYEDPPDLRDDRDETVYVVWYESPPGSGEFPAGGGQYQSVEEAVEAVERTCGESVVWEAT